MNKWPLVILIAVCVNVVAEGVVDVVIVSVDVVIVVVFVVVVVAIVVVVVVFVASADVIFSAILRKRSFMSTIVVLNLYYKQLLAGSHVCGKSSKQQTTSDATHAPFTAI